MFRILSVTFFTFLSLQGMALPQYQPDILNTVLKRVEMAETMPIVLFDIDDTLTNTRDRTLAVLNEFLSEPETVENYHPEVDRLSDLAIKHIRYEIEDTFHFFHIENVLFRNSAKSYWISRFFSDEYVKIDREIPGAKKYLANLQKAGARIVYLTGRDEPRMKKGTIAGLMRNGFPYNSNTQLLMKPLKEIPDLEFKQDAFKKIEKLGEVVGVFENEPANINAMQSYFKHATPIFLDTQHSNKPDVPATSVYWIKNYK